MLLSQNQVQSLPESAPSENTKQTKKPNTPAPKKPTSSKKKRAKLRKRRRKKKAKKKSAAQPKQSQVLKVYISRLPEKTRQEDLEAYLSQFGAFSDLKVKYRVLDKKTGAKVCKGYATAFADNQESYEGLLTLIREGGDLPEFGGHQITIEPYLKGNCLTEKMLDIEARQVSIYGCQDFPLKLLKKVFEERFGGVEEVAWSKKPSQDQFYGSVTFVEKSFVGDSLKAEKIAFEFGGEDTEVMIRKPLPKFQARLRYFKVDEKKGEKGGVVDGDREEVEVKEVGGEGGEGSREGGLENSQKQRRVEVGEGLEHRDVIGGLSPSRNDQAGAQTPPKLLSMKADQPEPKSADKKDQKPETPLKEAQKTPTQTIKLASRETPIKALP